MVVMGMRLLAEEPWIRWDWVGRHRNEILAAFGEHVELTLIAVAVGFLIAAPLGLLAARSQAVRDPILSLAGILYTIPSLSLFAMLVPFTGLSVMTSEIGLVGYTLLILIRNIVVGLDGVPRDVLEAARGMGYRSRALLFQIEIPMATPVILAGLRIATVTTIGLVTVTALIGQGGVGRLILDGLIRDFRTELVIGSVLAVALALVADLTLAGLQRLTTPWAQRTA
jgi:osmoprotectant transport system permease protein